MEVEKIAEKLGPPRAWLREILAEFVGTFVLVFLGNSSVAGLVFSKSFGDPRSVTSVHFAYGFAATLGILASGGGSGAHLNPAVTVALAVVGKFPWQKMFHYFLGQYLGAFVAAAATYFVYLDALNEFDKGERAVHGETGTAGIWTTYPQDYLTLWGGFFDQFVGTFILLLIVCSITDPRNMQVPKYLYPLYIGLLVVVIGISLGFNCGYAINPARDFSPRLFVTMCGWGAEAFTSHDFWWIPIVGPHLGAIFGTLFYVFVIEIHTAKEETMSFTSRTSRIQVIAAAKQ